MKKIFTTLYALLLAIAALGQHYQVDTLHKTGPLDNRINVVILGDGFTQQELPKFVAEAKKFADFFLNYDPYNRYKDYFNFFAIETPSKESGVTNPGTAPDAYPDQPVGKKDTFFGSSFGEGIHRLVTIRKWDVYGDLISSHFPMYDLVVVLVNTPYYGGSGGSIAVHTLHDQANRIGVHEVGHTFAHLNDEYWAGPGYGWEAPNMTMEKNAAKIRWKNWLNEPPIGIYQHGIGNGADEWYKPTSGACLMEYLDKEFCQVCREAVTETILETVNPIDRIEPSTTDTVDLQQHNKFVLTLLDPQPNTLEVQWRLNGVLLENPGSELILDPRLTPDSSVLVATVFDSTAASRKDGIRNVRTKTIQWSLKSAISNVFSAIASEDSVCAGETVTLTAYGCAGTLSWSTNDAGTSISVIPTQSTTYQASCAVSGKPVVTLDIPVTVIPLPEAQAANGGPYLVGETIELSAQGGNTYEWSGPQRFYANTANASVRPAEIANAGIYEVKVTDVNGCSKTAQTEVKVDPILAVPGGPEEWVKVSPNPASDRVIVETVLAGESTVTLYDQAGRKLLTRSFRSRTDITINAPAGMYLYRFVNGRREVTGKVAIR